MAKMIPQSISPAVKSPAERKIYEWFRDDPVTKDWVVFHSLGIENHCTVVYGEVDFLVAAAGCGIFALEVKGGRIKRENGVWIYTDKYGGEHEKARGPFEQASECMYSIKEQLNKRATSRGVKNILCGYGVMFPDVEYENTDIDAAREQIFDRRDGANVGKFILRLSEYNKKKLREKNVFAAYPSPSDIDEVVNILRRDFDQAVPLSTKIGYAEQAVIRLTEEQYRCIDGLRYNKRCLISGAAGTGKTILAVKNAKESVAESKKVGFFCYNLQLERELRGHFTDSLLQPAYVGSLTKYLENMLTEAGIADTGKSSGASEFYNEILPSLALDYLNEHPVKFDKIILDEAQDLLNGNYLLVIDALLNGGLKQGSWFFFGDFEYQTIYNKGITYDAAYKMLEAEAGFAAFHLTVNCRNTGKIQQEMNKIVGVDSQVLNPDKNAPSVRFFQFADVDEEAAMLEKEIAALIDSGIKKRDITILSPFLYENSAASKIKKYKIARTGTGSKEVTYSTIQGFKGLENSVIILTDIRTYNSPDLMYVGMSRARSLLYIFETKQAKNYRSNLCLKNK